jgi:hypothetical protein
VDSRLLDLSHISPNLRPGLCKGKARREHLGYGGQRVLTSRKWSGKSLADHRADRQAWLTETLGFCRFPPSTAARGRSAFGN